MPLDIFRTLNIFESVQRYQNMDIFTASMYFLSELNFLKAWVFLIALNVHERVNSMFILKALNVFENVFESIKHFWER